MLIIFDDASQELNAHQYLYGDGPVDVDVKLPNDKFWHDQDLGHVVSRTDATGIKGKIAVVRMGDTPKNVVNATCLAFSWMVEMFGPEHGIVMLQDDVVFNHDWLDRMIAAQAHTVPGAPPLGLITGSWSNCPNPDPREPITYVPSRGITAQCYFVTPTGIAAVYDWTKRMHPYNKGFDNKFCANIRTGGASVYRMHPAVCQHIGIVSTVRPHWGWRRHGAQGRVDLTARGPFGLADQVRSFRWEIDDAEDPGSRPAEDRNE